MALCAFNPYGRQCPNPATVMVTITGGGSPPEDVRVCDDHVHDYIDEVAATARRLDPQPESSPDHQAP